jgi:hypothetical protein
MRERWPRDGSSPLLDRESVRGEATGGDSRAPRQGRKPTFFEARTSAAHLSMIVSASARLCGLVLHVDVRHDWLRATAVVRESTRAMVSAPRPFTN